MTTCTRRHQATPVAARLTRAGRPRGLADVLALAVSLAVCYGTLGLIAVLSTFGFALLPDQATVEFVAVALAVIATASVSDGARRHGGLRPLLLVVAGAALLSTLMIVGMNRLLELIAFALLIAAVSLDCRLLACSRR